MAAGEDDGQREGALEPHQDLGDRILRTQLLVQVVGQQVDHDLGVGFGLECVTEFAQLLAQLLEVLDDAVVHQRDAIVRVGVGIGLGRLAVSRPAGVADADGAADRLALQKRAQVAELALGAAALDLAVDQGRHAGGIVAAILEPLESVEQQGRDRRRSDDSDDPAHDRTPLLVQLFFSPPPGRS